MAIVFENKLDQEVPDVDLDKVAQCFSDVSKLRGWEASLSYVSKEEIQRLNRETRNLDKPTDVLSFPVHEKGKIQEGPDGVISLGDVVICLEVVRESVEGEQVKAEKRTKELIIHGLLHLIGYDHEDDRNFEIMHDKEQLIFKCL